MYDTTDCLGSNEMTLQGNPFKTMQKDWNVDTLCTNAFQFKYNNKIQ